MPDTMPTADAAADAAPNTALPGPGALDGLRVLDLSRVLAGPWCAQNLADLGADVVKVESPDGGDDTRKWGPPFVTEPETGRRDAAYYFATNRNKRSIAVDFRQPEGLDLVRDLARQADVVIENFKLGGLRKYGLDVESIREINPNVIYCSITGFGQTGPYAARPGYDFLLQGMGGLMSFTGLPDGVPGAGPMKVGVAVCDLFTAMYATTAILAAVVHREKTGEGQHIDCALFDTQIAVLANQASNWLNGGTVPQRMGNNHPNVVPYRVYPVADGHIIIACGNDRQFRALMGALGAPELAEDARFDSNEARVTNRDAIDAIIEHLLKDTPRDAALQRIEAAGVPCGPINDVADVFADPHVQARGAMVEQTDDTGLTTRSVAFPARLERTPASYRRAPPRLGQNGAEVLSDWAGYDAERVAALRRDGVI
ncbi:CaiB/BaiF CoA transferase family protein [Maritimibacter alkaliphilus]|uniref:CaiB/BaiF CoA transferase family protein n=1 Tax=Maritimibacter alkaliphilus TaxID=404236 RepID=UPI0021BD4758|nr:CaiB/BaiF CoA-transferase family protein [Maritimibacter alkaliphilus]